MAAQDDGDATPLLDDIDPPGNWGELVDVLGESLAALAEGLVARLPLIALAVVVLLVGLVLVRVALGWFERGLRRRRADRAVQGLTLQLARLILITLVLVYALSVAGVRVGAVLAGLGLAGLALAFAMQNILENFVAGILILLRKPFRRGDQIQSNDFAGTVEDIDLRVTKVKVFDGELVLIPNATVFTEPIVNLTRLGTRRTRVEVGIDYRDDHDRARDVLLAAVRAVDGVQETPEPEVLCIALGDSSVDFEVAYWTQPDMRTVRHVRDRVLRACKTAVEAEGMTIPWPIRTLEWGQQPLPVQDDAGTRDEV